MEEDCRAREETEGFLALSAFVLDTLEPFFFFFLPFLPFRLIFDCVSSRSRVVLDLDLLPAESLGSVVFFYRSDSMASFCPAFQIS
jgi:hypothetical protein